jgi:hypothetical protein
MLILHEGYAATDLITDMFVLTLPLWPVWKMNLPIKDKLQVGAVFLVAYL